MTGSDGPSPSESESQAGPDTRPDTGGSARTPQADETATTADASSGRPVAEGSVAPPRVSGETLDVLLHTHEQLREEIRGHGKRKSRRFVATFTVTGVVVGYVFARGGDSRLLTILPLVLAFQMLSHISSRTYVAELSGVLARIEKQIDCAGVEYESHYGMLPTGRQPLYDDVSLSTRFETPPGANATVTVGLWGLATISYLGVAVAGLEAVVRRGVADVQLVAVTGSPSAVEAMVLWGLVVVYLLLGAVVAFAFVQYRQERQREALLFESVAVADYEGVATRMEQGSDASGDAADESD